MNIRWSRVYSKRHGIREKITSSIDKAEIADYTNGVFEKDQHVLPHLRFSD